MFWRESRWQQQPLSAAQHVRNESKITQLTEKLNHNNYNIHTNTYKYIHIKRGRY